MIRRANEYAVTTRENMRGGDGSVVTTSVVEKEELNEKGRLFGTIRLEPGCSIGYHVHEGESEIFHFLSGSAVYNANGEEVVVREGDTTVTSSGQGHAVKNVSDKPCVVLALIVYA